MVPAGLEKGVGVITMGFVKDQTDPQWVRFGEPIAN